MSAPSPHVVAAVLLALALAVLGPAVKTPWLWDDQTLIVESPVLDHPEALPRALTRDFWAISANPRALGMYRPLVTASYFADRALFGRSPVGPHAVNLALHLAAAALLALLARRLGATPLEALLGAALFGFHPVVVEAIANVASRCDLLATMFVLASFLALRRPGPGGLVAAALLLALGLLSKESAFVALPLALGLEWWASGFRVDWRRWLQVAVALGTVTAAGLLLRGVVLGGAVRLAEGEGWQPLLSGASGVLRYAARAVWPWPLVPYQPATQTSLWPIAALGAAAALAGLTWRRHPHVLLAVGWFLVATAPVTGWLPVKVRFSGLLLYLPLTGLALLTARSLGTMRPVVQWAIPGAFAAMSLALVPMWSSAEALWGANVEAFPTLAAPRLNLANALANERRSDEALSAYQEAIAAAAAEGDTKSQVLAEHGLGNLQLDSSPGEAEPHFQRALELSGQLLWQAAVNLAVAQAKQGRLTDAAATLEAQWTRTPAPALARAGLRLAEDRNDPEARARWGARVSGRR